MKTIIPNIDISAITSFLPTENLELFSLSSEYGEKAVTTIMQATGIERVRISGKDQTASDLCFEAAIHLLRNEKLEKTQIGGLVFVSQTPDYVLPSTSIILQDRLQLSKETICIDIRYGCSGYIYGILQAALWINTCGCENVLVLAGDTSSKIINQKDKSLRMVFGDCGTATLVKKGNSSLGFSINSDGSGYDRLIIPAGGFRRPFTESTKKIVFDEDNNGRTQEDMYMDGMAIFDFVITNVHKNINDLITQMGWEKNEVGLYALHQANKFIVNSVRKKMKIENEKVPLDVANYGNTGPATIPLLLTNLGKETSYNLEKVIMCGFGVGLSWGSIAGDLRNTHFYEPINK